VVEIQVHGSFVVLGDDAHAAVPVNDEFGIRKNLVVDVDRQLVGILRHGARNELVVFHRLKHQFSDGIGIALPTDKEVPLVFLQKGLGGLGLFVRRKRRQPEMRQGLGGNRRVGSGYGSSGSEWVCPLENAQQGCVGGWHMVSL